MSARIEASVEANAEDQLLRDVALKNATSILQLRQRAEAELLGAQGALRESQQRLQAALSASHAGTFRWDLENDTIDSDANLERVFGFAPTADVHTIQDFVEAVHPDDRKNVNENVERCRKDAADFDMEFRVVWPDGSIHWIEDKATRMHDANGNAQYLIGACHDITARKKVESELRASAERFRAVFNQAAVGIAVANLDGRLVQVNQQFADILGYTPEELAMRTIGELTHPDDVDNTAGVMHRLLEEKIPEYVYEKRYIRKDGSAVWS
ncbi:MAG: PAS domain S-box protein, partial [Gemmatimonadota bacterium]|nr:PAS domain S-box protein [Gemmatimonadota bacterium]